MRRPSTVSIVLLLILWALGTPALAADLWLQPEPPAARPGDTVRLHLFEGAAFRASERPFRSGDVDLLQRLWRSGRANLTGSEGGTPLASFTVRRPGVNLLVYDASTGDKFCKAFVVVGEPDEGDPLRWSEVGQTLEIVPQSDPVTLARRGGTLEVQVLFDREPLAGTKVTAVPEAAPAAGVRSATTDEIGIVRFRLDRPGRWLVLVAHRGRCEGCEGRAPESFSATLLLTVGPAG